MRAVKKKKKFKKVGGWNWGKLLSHSAADIISVSVTRGKKKETFKRDKTRIEN